MLGVGERVDDRRARRACDGEQVAMGHQSGHDAVGVAVEDAADVSRRFALAELHLGIEERDRVPAQAVDGHLEGHACAIAGTLEDQCDGAAVERPAQLPAALGGRGEIQDGGQLRRRQVGQAQQIAATQGGAHRQSIWKHAPASRDATLAP